MENRSVRCPLCGHLAVWHFALEHTVVRRCAAPTCGLQFADPQLDENALARAYAEHYYPSNGNGSEPTYENTPKIVFRQAFHQLQDKLGALEGLKLLDFGSGRGSLSLVAQEFGILPVGIEPDPQARAIAASTVGMVTYASLSELPKTEPSALFNLVVLWTVIEHLRKPWVDLRHLGEFLRPDGWLLVFTMNIRCLRARMEQKQWESYRNPTHFFHFDRCSLGRTVRSAGYEHILEWRPRLRFPHHGILRRWIYEISSSFGLADGLFCLCQKQTTPESG